MLCNSYPIDHTLWNKLIVLPVFPFLSFYFSYRCGQGSLQNSRLSGRHKNNPAATNVAAIVTITATAYQRLCFAGQQRVCWKHNSSAYSISTTFCQLGHEPLAAIHSRRGCFLYNQAAGESEEVFEHVGAVRKRYKYRCWRESSQSCSQSSGELLYT